MRPIIVMYCNNITVKSKISDSSFGRGIISTPLDDQYTMHEESLRNLQSYYAYRIKLNIDNVYDNTWYESASKTVSEYNYPLRSLRNKHTMKWLDLFEIYSYVGSHNNLFLVDAAEFCKLGQRIEVTGEDTSTSTLRQWKNAIDIGLKRMDLLVSCIDSCVESIIIFALYALDLGASAIIKVPFLKYSSLVASIHLFCMCFKNVNIVHTIANDSIYLVGVDLIHKIDLLEDFNENYKGFHDTILFKDSYIEDENTRLLFTDTVDNLLNFSNKVYKWRLKYYEKLFDTVNELTSSVAALLFTKYNIRILEEQYPEKTAEWKKKTKYPRIK